MKSVIGLILFPVMAFAAPSNSTTRRVPADAQSAAKISAVVPAKKTVRPYSKMTITKGSFEISAPDFPKTITLEYFGVTPTVGARINDKAEASVSIPFHYMSAQFDDGRQTSPRDIGRPALEGQYFVQKSVERDLAVVGGMKLPMFDTSVGSPNNSRVWEVSAGGAGRMRIKNSSASMIASSRLALNSKYEDDEKMEGSPKTHVELQRGPLWKNSFGIMNQLNYSTFGIRMNTIHNVISETEEKRKPENANERKTSYKPTVYWAAELFASMVVAEKTELGISLVKDLTSNSNRAIDTMNNAVEPNEVLTTAASVYLTQSF